MYRTHFDRRPAASVFRKPQAGNTVGEAERVVIEDVHDAIVDLMELIKTFRSKNKLSRLFLSTIFKRRQAELDAVMNQAVSRLQVSGHRSCSVLHMALRWRSCLRAGGSSYPSARGVCGFAIASP